MIGVAISTTGDEHRLKFLETCVKAWRLRLPWGATLVITVDGDEAACDRVFSIYDHSQFGNVYRVGQGRPSREGHQGVAVNKNTGIELLMEAGVTDLFLCDDDTWPTHPEALSLHSESVLQHSMICWGGGRLIKQYRNYASWKWPRGVLLYADRYVVEQIGGMDERFGPGGHEHVEWSRRIYQAGITPRAFCSPPAYADDNGMGVQDFWMCSDIRRTHKTSVRRVGKDWDHINKIMDERDGDTTFVPYAAAENGRESATLWADLRVPPEDAKEPGSK